MKRIFVYEGTEYPDPNPEATVDQVRQILTSYFPQLANADTNDLGERKVKDSEEMEHLWEFKSRVGRKGYRLGEYPVIIRVFSNRKGLNFVRWVWSCTDLFQDVRVGTFPKCELGRCNVAPSMYAGGDEWVADMLRHGLCPHCGNSTVEKYALPPLKTPPEAYWQPLQAS